MTEQTFKFAPPDSMEFDHVCDLIERFNLVSYVSAELQPNDRAISVTVTDPRDAR